MLRRTLVPSALFVWWVTALLHAHPVSVAFAEVNVEGRQIHWRLHIPAVDMDTFFHIENLSRAQPRVTQYFATKVKVAQDGRDLPAMFSPLQICKDPHGNAYAEPAARADAKLQDGRVHYSRGSRGAMGVRKRRNLRDQLCRAGSPVCGI